MNDGLEDIGVAVTAGLAARELGRGGSATGGEGDGGACANCGAAAASAFCPDCGQATHVHRNLRGLGHDIAHGVFHFEGRIWRTLPLLAWRPGELTRRYVHGQRARFIPPMALFLFSVFIMFTTFAVLAPHDGEPSATVVGRTDLAGQRQQLKAQLAGLRVAKANAAPAQRERIQDSIDAAVDDLKANAKGYAQVDGAHGTPVEYNVDWPWLKQRVERAQSNPGLLLYKVKTSAYKFSWLLIPLSLPFLWLLFPLRRDVGLYDHAIFATYSLAFMTLLVAVLAVASAIGVSGGLIFLALAVVVPLHMYRQLRGAYLLGRLGGALRTVALLTFSLIVALLFVVLLLWLEAA